MDSNVSRKDTLFEQADTYEHCEERIREKFGMNYMILKRRTIRTGGFLGFFEKEGVELQFVPTSYEKPKNYIPSTYPDLKKTEDLEEVKKRLLAAVPTKTLPNPQIQKMSEDMETIKELLKTVQLGSKMPEHQTITRIENILTDNEFTPLYIRKIVEKIRKEFSIEDLDDFDRIQDAVVEWIGETIVIDNEHPRFTPPRILILIGPTGVGKTTTVAKLAASFTMDSPVNQYGSRTVRMVTIDNYRIKAKEQIETYGDLMEVPVSMVENIDDFKKIIALHKDDTQVILVDTIGYCPNDSKKIAEMKGRLNLHNASIELYLTISATTKTSDMKEIIQQFELFGYKSVILTKLDETRKVGNIISVLDEKHKSISIITDGQVVPTDIRKASVIDFLIRLDGFTVNRSKIEERFASQDAVY